ncbi:MAG: hypothetical protein PHF21_04175 [Bacilli bacterium]|nr:hypothetical protein [Bacilli bacterium]
MDFNKIIDKYNYEEKTHKILKEIYNALVNYYGAIYKEIIYDALLNTEIVIKTGGTVIYDELNKRGYLNPSNQKNIVKNEDLKRANGVYFTDYDVFYKDEKYFLGDRRSIIIINDFNNHEALISSLIHEIGHLIKSYNQEAVIKEDRLYLRSGLIESVYKLNNEGLIVNKELIKETGVGLEEGLNALDEENIMKLYFEPDYKVKGYQSLATLISKFITKFDLQEEVFNSQFYKNKHSLKEKLNPELYEKLEYSFDELYQKYLKLFANIFNPEISKDIGLEMEDIIISQMLPIFNKLKENSVCQNYQK